MHEFVARPLIAQPDSNGRELFDTVGYKLAEGKGLREGWDSKELWESLEKVKDPSSRGAKDGPPAL